MNYSFFIYCVSGGKVRSGWIVLKNFQVELA